ncbi:unnamed protein product [Amoebophrya sp. A120]|nr:unnamed protein product [Amoebophrya sp. A120]|eukprot:GSA120T00021628001.1
MPATAARVVASDHDRVRAITSAAAAKAEEVRMKQELMATLQQDAGRTADGKVLQLSLMTKHLEEEQRSTMRAHARTSTGPVSTSSYASERSLDALLSEMERAAEGRPPKQYIVEGCAQLFGQTEGDKRVDHSSAGVTSRRDMCLELALIGKLQSPIA